MPEDTSWDIMRSAQQFQQGRATLQDTQAQAEERRLKNDETRTQIAAFSGMGDGTDKSNVSVGPWQDSEDPSVGGDLPQMRAAAAFQASLPGDGVRSDADKFTAMGKKLMGTGAPSAGLNLVKAASEMRTQAATADKDAAQANEARMNAAIHSLQVAGQVMNPDVVTDQTRYDQAKQQLAQIPGVDPRVVQGLPATYDPAVVDRLSRQSTTRQEQLKFQQDAMRNKMEATRIANEQQFHQDTLAMEQAKLTEQKRKEDFDKKLGLMPNKEFVDQVHDQLINRVFGGKDPTRYSDSGRIIAKNTSLESGADTISERAMTMFAEGKGLTKGEAINRAIQESIDAGDWPQHQDDMSAAADDDNPVTPHFSPIGKTPSSPMPPRKFGEIPLPGKWYSTSSGKPPLKYISGDTWQTQDGRKITIKDN